MSDMKKKRPKADKQADRHVGRVLAGIPADIHAVIRALAEENSRPVTWELRLLLVEALTARKRWPVTST